MATSLTVNNVSFSFPSPGDQNWGQNVSDWAAAVTSGMLQKAGGSFTLTAEVDFGAGFGLKSLYYKTRTVNGASAGQIRLARADVLSWRNEADNANLDLSVSSSNQLLFNGAALGVFGSVTDTTTIDLTLTGTALSAAVQATSLTNAHVSAAAALARSKFATGSAYRLVVNDATGAMVDASAITAGKALISDANGVPVAGGATDGELALLNGASSNIQTQLNARLPLSGGTLTGALTLSAAPTSTLHAATKQYVDDAIMGLSVHDSVRVATTGAGTLATSFENGDTVDGVVLATGNRILIKNQGATSENGIYVVAASGAPTRATDADTWEELVQAFVVVTAGTANAGTSWVSQTQSGGTLGVNTVTFGQFGSAASYTADGSGIELSSTTFSLELDGATLSKSASGLKIADLGVANAQVSASAAIARSKIATGTANRLVYNADTTGAMSDLGAITASRALVSDANGLPSASAVTATTLAFLDATSSVQTQLDAKMPKSGGTFTGGVSGTTLALSGAMTGASSDVSGESECGTLDCVGNAAVGGNLVVTGTATVGGASLVTEDDIVYQAVITATVVGSAADEIDITGIPAFDFYEVYLDVALNNSSGTEQIDVYFNNDTSALYKTYTSSGLTAARLVSVPLLTTGSFFGKWMINNPEARVKTVVPLGAGLVANTAGVVTSYNVGAGTISLYGYDPSATSGPTALAIDRAVSVWNNTSAQIDRMTFILGNSAQFQVGSRVKIVGFNF